MAKKAGLYSPETARGVLNDIAALKARTSGHTSYSGVEVEPIVLANNWTNNEEIPPFGCVQCELAVPVDGSDPTKFATQDETLTTGGHLLRVTRPNRFDAQVYLLNGPTAIGPTAGYYSRSKLGNAQTHPLWWIGRVDDWQKGWQGNRFSHQVDSFELMENYGGPWVSLGVYSKDENLIHGIIQPDPPHKVFQVDGNGIAAAVGTVPGVGYGVPQVTTGLTGPTTSEQFNLSNGLSDPSLWSVRLQNWGSAVAADAIVQAKPSGWVMTVDVEYC